MSELENLWPDGDRRDGALYRIAADIAHAPDERTQVHPAELRALQAISLGLDEAGAACVLGLAHVTVTTQLRNARRALRAKNTTHACCEALRQGLIR